MFGLRGLNTDSKTLQGMSASNLVSAPSRYSILWDYAKNRTQVYMYVAPAIISMLIASGGTIDLLSLAVVSVSVYFAALAVYIYNDIFDMKVDRVNSTNRPLVASRATRKDLAVLTILLNVASISLIFTTNIWATASMLAFILLGVVYSHPRTSLKDKFLFKTIVAGIGGVLTAMVGALAVGLLPIYVLYVASATFASFFILGSLGDIGDLKGDREARRRTIPIVMGVRNTVALLLMISTSVGVLTVILSQFLNMNILGMFLALASSMAMGVVLTHVPKSAEARTSMMKIRYKMRTLHLLLQASMLIGAIHFF